MFRTTRARLRPPPAVLLAPFCGLYCAITLIAQRPGVIGGDEGPLLRFAAHLLDGRYAGAPTQDATAFLWHGPGLPALLAPLVALQLPLEAVRLLGPLLLFAAVVGFERLLRHFVSPRRALLGACALGLYFPFYSLLPTLHKEPLALLLIVVGLERSTVALRDGSRWAAGAAGVAFGLLALTRLEFGWVMIALLVVAVARVAASRRPDHPGGGPGARPRRRLVLVYAVAVLVCVPWLGYTYALTGRPLYWGNAGGLSLYWMSSPASGQLGDWHSVHAVLRDPRLAGQRPFFEHLATLDRLARDLTLQRVALRQIASHPANFASHVADNAGRMLFDAPYSAGRPPAEILSVALANLLLGLALAGALVLWWRERRKDERPSEEATAFGLLAAGAFAVHLPLSADPRMLMPIVPIAVWALARVPWRVSALAPRRAKASEAVSG